MLKLLAVLATCGFAATAGAAFADPSQPYGMDRNSGHQSAGQDLPHCDRPIGVAAVQEPDHDWWSPLGLSNPEAVLKMFALQSGCLRMVDRNKGLAMRNQEEGLNRGGELQRGSNLGRGQVLAADYFIIPDIARQNSDSGGGNMVGMFGHFLPGAAGAIVGSISIHSQEASTLITLVDARTTEQMYVAQGDAKKTDVGFGGGGGWGGWAGYGALAGSGYTNTDIGKVIMAAYYKSFVDLVHYMQTQQPGGAQENAPIAAQVVNREVQLRKSASVRAPIVYTLHAGALVYPTGSRNGIWMEVDDENGNRGWMSSAYTTPR
ncbi:MAG TPA: CsgG/HfaB family protein [Caulobacteraceae bacterium]|nr:CsgG/HfaB family protein [Caulobacteraceae bacterium]